MFSKSSVLCNAHDSTLYYKLLQNIISSTTYKGGGRFTDEILGVLNYTKKQPVGENLCTRQY